MKTYEAHVSSPNGGMMRVTVQANNPLDARAQLEAQYGKKAIQIPPQEVR